MQIMSFIFFTQKEIVTVCSSIYNIFSCPLKSLKLKKSRIIIIVWSAVI